MNRDEILKSLKEMLKTELNISYEEYWNRINKLSEKEKEAFMEESKNMKLSLETLHRPFTI